MAGTLAGSPRSCGFAGGKIWGASTIQQPPGVLWGLEQEQTKPTGLRQNC